MTIKNVILQAITMPSRARERVKSAIFHLKVTLLEVEPAVWRLVRVPGDIHLGHFHMLLQVLMPWDDLHEHRFLIGNEQFGARKRGHHAMRQTCATSLGSPCRRPLG
jgi:hypothetical protein